MHTLIRLYAHLIKNQAFSSVSLCFVLAQQSPLSIYNQLVN